MNAHSIPQLHLIYGYFINKNAPAFFLFVHHPEYFHTCKIDSKHLASASANMAGFIWCRFSGEKLSLLRKIEPLNDYFL